MSEFLAALWEGTIRPFTCDVIELLLAVAGLVGFGVTVYGVIDILVRQ